jgi:hypothetical protein
MGLEVRCGLILRDRCAKIRERAAQTAADAGLAAARSKNTRPDDVLPDVDNFPADPTDGLLSTQWWQVPTLFLSAFGVASALLKWAGMDKLIGL